MPPSHVRLEKKFSRHLSLCSPHGSVLVLQLINKYHAFVALQASFKIFTWKLQTSVFFYRRRSAARSLAWCTSFHPQFLPFLTQCNSKCSYIHTYTHPYKCTHARPIFMSISIHDFNLLTVIACKNLFQMMARRAERVRSLLEQIIFLFLRELRTNRCHLHYFRQTWT